MEQTSVGTKLPTDLSKTLAKNAKAKAQWDGLTAISRRDFITWIESAKQAETRKRRVESVPSRLVSGKRRICCFAVVPMNLYKALSELPKAKAQWSTLSADEKRDLAAWIDEGIDSKARTERIGKTCSLLLNGKRHP